VNTKEIIESGKLELYVCGALSEREMREIALLADLNADLRQEISRIEIDLVNYAESFEKAPSQEALDKVLKNIKGGNKTFQVDFRSNTFNWAYLASIIGFIILGGLSFYFWKQTMDLRNDVQVITPLNDSMEVLKSGLSTRDATIEFLSRPSTRKYKLVGIEGKDSNDNYIILYWCQSKKEVRVSPGNLPKPPAGMQYQLWAMVDGKPVSEGLFTMQELQEMKITPRAEAFGVTLEKAGGAAQPNMDALKVFRKV
jgi:anti-sigma-K factor RskA